MFGSGTLPSTTVLAHGTMPTYQTMEQHAGGRPLSGTGQGVASLLGSGQTSIGLRGRPGESVVVSTAEIKALTAQLGGNLSAAVKQILSEAVAGLRDITKTASPSQEMHRIGSDIGQGAINGLNSKVDDAARAGESIGQATVNGTQAGARKPGTREAASRPQGPAGPVSPMFMSQKQRDERKEMIRQRAKNAFGIGGKVNKVAGSVANSVKGMGGMGVGMGISMAGGAMAMVPGLEGIGGALAMIGPLFMMLPAPIAGVVAGLAAMVGVVMSANAAIEQQRKTTVEAANANSVNNAALNQLAEDLGTVSTSQSAAAGRDAAFAGTTTAQLSSGQQLLESSGGAQAILAGTQKQLEQGATADKVGAALARTLSTAVLQGIMSSGEATSLASAIAEKTGNFNVATAANAQLSQLTGNNAQDIATVLGANQGTAGAYAAIQQGATATSTTVGRNPFGTTGQAVAETLAKPEIAGLAIQEMNNYAQAVGAADVAVADATLSEKERKNALQLSLNKQKESLAAVTLYAEKIGSEEFGKYIRTQVEFMYPEDPAAQSVLSMLEGNTIPEGEFKTLVTTQFAGGAISPSIATFLLTSAQKNKNFQQRFTLLANTQGLQAALAILAKTKIAIDIVSSNTKGILTDLKKGQISANRLENTVANTLKMQGEDVKTVGTDPLGDLGGVIDNSGGSTNTTEDKVLTQLQAKLDKRSKALNIISLQEAKINKKYDERKKALEEIAKINGQIAEQQKSQLDIADALSRGDIASAARAVQAERARAAAFAQEQQMKALEEDRQKSLGSITFKGMTRESLQAQIDKLNMQIALREYKKASGGGMMKGYAGGGIMKRYSTGGKVMSYFAAGGSPLGSDTIPAMLTPGEFVIKRPAVQNFGVKKLEKINNGGNPSSGVYNYNVSVNVSTGSDPDKIARTVVTKIRSIDKQRLGGNSY